MSTWIVTGASRGLGRALVLALAARGHRVLACARAGAGLSSLEQAAAPGRIVAVPLDLGDAAAVAPAVAAMVAAHGPIAGVINNAGIGHYKPFLDHPEAELLQILQVNLGAVMQVCRALLPHLLEQGGGQIINIGSDLARRPLANMAAYVASKHGLAGFSHSLLREVKDRGVRVSLVNPGIIDTGFGGNGSDGPGSAGRLGPAALAAVVMHLLDAPASLVLDEVTVHPVAQPEF
jgi:short-subunit dehydrogenase